MREKELIVYRGLAGDELLCDISRIVSNAESADVLNNLMYSCIHRLLNMASGSGFYGNLWHCYLANLIANDENSYSCACEIRGEIFGSINEAVLQDFEIIREMYRLNLETLAGNLGVRGIGLVLDYEGGKRLGSVYNTRIRDRICELATQMDEAESCEAMKQVVTLFYRDYGVGKFGLHKAFRVEQLKEGTDIRPILNIAHVQLSDLIGYDIPKKKLTDNTEAFVSGKKANNCLLFGDAGTGKSSCIKAIANAYYDRGLRIIEIYRHQFKALNDVISQIKNRNYKFIIYMDDLSFEDFETEYKYLKAVIEGGLEKKPQNVLIYATSNRRHLIRETFKDRADSADELHEGDTVQEKLSLSSRFGVTIYFGSPEKKEFQNIVLGLAERNGITLPKEELLLLANKWELSHGGLSGRTAQQFIDYLLGSMQN